MMLVKCPQCNIDFSPSLGRCPVCGIWEPTRADFQAYDDKLSQDAIAEANERIRQLWVWWWILMWIGLPLAVILGIGLAVIPL